MTFAYDKMKHQNESLFKGRWLEGLRTRYADHRGEERSWEWARRPNFHGAVAIIATLPGDPEEILLVEQFRPPVGKPVLSFPAGLIDAGEEIDVAALRELGEETGYTGEITGRGPACYSSPGLTDESIFWIQVRVTGKYPLPMDESEGIVVHRVPLNDLKARLSAWEAESKGIDVKLWYYAIGLSG